MMPILYLFYGLKLSLFFKHCAQIYSAVIAECLIDPVTSKVLSIREVWGCLSDAVDLTKESSKATY